MQWKMYECIIMVYNGTSEQQNVCDTKIFTFHKSFFEKVNSSRDKLGQ